MVIFKKNMSGKRKSLKNLNNLPLVFTKKQGFKVLLCYFNFTGPGASPLTELLTEQKKK